MHTDVSKSNRSTALRASFGVALPVLLGLVVCVGYQRMGGVFASEDCTNAQPGASDYCDSDECGPCLDAEGDCDPGQCQAGLECVEEGSVDRCRPVDDTCSAQPGAGDYCTSNQCGPCADGEGDCDPGQCDAGLECVEEGAVDRCRPIDDSCAAQPGSGDYCSSSQCGPCLDGEGDCDPGQCDAGLECVEEGSVDHCRPIASGCSAQPGSGDYCSSNQCGPCADGEGDCDPGQCQTGLDCVEEGSVDHCRPAPIGGGTSNFQVNIGGVWQGICCNGGVLEVSSGDCVWTELNRTLTDATEGRELDCPEGGPTDCDCDSSGERMHGRNGGNLSSLKTTNGSNLYSNSGQETCVVVAADGELRTESTSSSCPFFRLQ